MNRKTARGYLYAILSAMIYGCMPLMAKAIYADGVTPFTVVFLRNFLALIPLALLAYGEQKTLKIPLKLLPSLSVIAILGCCLTPLLLFSSYNYIASGTATVFHYAYPAIVVMGEILIFRKKMQIGSTISILLCVIGISLFYSPDEPINLTGSILALFSAVTFASYVMLLSRFDRSKVSVFSFSFYIALISSIGAFFACVVTGNLAFPATARGWGLCLLFALLVTVGAVVLFQQSTFLIGGERTSILSTLEPITSLVIGAIVFREALGLRILIGVLFVLSASILTALIDIRKNKQKA